jgi:hypothetical protein
MTSFIGYINNPMIKLTIYFNSHMCIDEQITNFQVNPCIHSYRTVVHTNIKMLVLFFLHIFFQNKYLVQGYICNLSTLTFGILRLPVTLRNLQGSLMTLTHMVTG